MLNAMPSACVYRGNVIPAFAGIQIRGDHLDSRVGENMLYFFFKIRFISLTVQSPSLS